MCQSKAEGGKRCPRHRRDAIVAIKLAVASSDLPVESVEAIFVDLRREGRGVTYRNLEDKYAKLVERLRNDSEIKLSSQYQSILSEYVQDGLPAPETLYALERLEGSALKSSLKLDNEIDELTGRHLRSNEIKARFKELRKNALNNSKDMSSSKYHTLEAQNRAYDRDIPTDRATIIAVEKLREEIKSRPDRRKRFTPEDYAPIPSGAFSHVAYDPRDQLLSLRARKGEEHIQYCRVPEELYEEWQSRGYDEPFYTRNIRGNPAYRYPSLEVAERDAYAYRCADCGQFRALSHACADAPTPQNGDRGNQTTGGSPSHPALAPVGRTNRRSGRRGSRPTIISLEDHIAQKLAHKEVDVKSGRKALTFHNKAAIGSRNTIHAKIPSEMGEDIDGPYDYYAAMSLGEGEYHLPSQLALQSAIKHYDEVEAPFYLTSYIIDPKKKFRVDGKFKFVRDSDGTITRSVSSLRCTCGSFTSASGDCLHVKALQQHQGSMFSSDVLPGVDVPTSNKANKALQSLFADTGWHEHPHIMERALQDGSSFEEARVAISKETEEKKEPFIAFLGRHKHRALEKAYRHYRKYAIYQESQRKLWEDRDQPYGGNIEAVKALITETQTQKGSRADILVYNNENVTDGVCDPSIPGSRRFGVELEFVLPPNQDKHAKLAEIAAELHSAGLSDKDHLGGYHAGRAAGWPAWSLEGDPTVHGELVSPLMADTPEHWEQLKKAITILKGHGATASVQAGSHVHVSTGSYAGKLAKAVEVLRIVKDSEDILYRAASNPFSSSHSHRGTKYCTPNVSTTYLGDIGEHHYIRSTKHQIDNRLSAHVHGNSVNLEDNGGMNPKSHIEYRLWDSSLDPSVIQKQIMISVAITEAAERTTEANGGLSVARGEWGENEKHTRLGATSRRLGVNGAYSVDDAAAANVASFVDRVFRRKEDREDFIRLYALNKNPKK